MRLPLAILRDPMIALLVLATALALTVPATGEVRAIAQQVANVAIFVLFLVNGMRVARSEIARGVANWRYFLPLMLFVFGAMALAGLAFAWIGTGLIPPLLALGFLYLGVLPSTIQSATSYTTLANGNVALAVIGAALTSLIGVVISAPLFALLDGGATGAQGADVLIKIGLILVLPFGIGQAVQGWTREWVIARKSKIVWLDRGVIALAVYVAMSGAAEQDLLGKLDGASWAVFVGLIAGFLLVAHVGAWLASGALGLPRSDRISFLFGGAQKSVAVGAPLAAILFPPDVAGFVIAPVLLYHLLQLVIAAPLANRLASHPD